MGSNNKNNKLKDAFYYTIGTFLITSFIVFIGYGGAVITTGSQKPTYKSSPSQFTNDNIRKRMKVHEENSLEGRLGRYKNLVSQADSKMYEDNLKELVTKEKKRLAKVREKKREDAEAKAKKEEEKRLAKEKKLAAEQEDKREQQLQLLAEKKEKSKKESRSKQKPKEKIKKRKPVETNTMTMEATAYVAFCDTQCTGTTKEGTDVSGTIYHPSGNKIIAVDPNVIPLGTMVEINGEKYIADDTGGDIQQNRIDILVNSESEARKFGRQNVEVRILH
ncbi:3D (Asp-Asp-Asp) domain-containing protein [Virgibacillus halotolerans]|uniref:3D domain-containing protein n=1 Tax=Virgibacillus halotolerans TaxID=1071053 RepID=UPI001EF87106|nr:3D domain-containing protein [Virgibacillus halotolerans]MBM7598218.1 3D (Asp-Asp-Asp) domain-containing protein [Virgibacillus halotolerans]